MFIVITLNGLPNWLEDTTELEDLALKVLPAAVAGIAELKIPKNRVFVFAPKDMLLEGLGEELVAFIDGSPIEGWAEGLLSHAVRNALIDFEQSNVPECKSTEVVYRLRRADV